MFADRTPATAEPPVLDLRLGGLSLGGVPVLGRMDLTVAPRETLAVVGPSGIGKSTLLRIFAGLEARFDGSCRIDGRVAIVFQEPALLPWRSLLDNIIVATGVSADMARAALKEVGLGGRWQSFPNRLSLGQQRRVALARAFAVPPDLLLLDEPFVSLDPALSEEMMALFQKLRERHRMATILVTHVQAEADRLADRVITLGGAPARIMSEDQKSGAYFHSSASGVTASGS